jgi:hypothetical protein
LNTLTKLALGLMGQLRPQPAAGNAAHSITLPARRLAADGSALASRIAA